MKLNKKILIYGFIIILILTNVNAIISNSDVKICMPLNETTGYTAIDQMSFMNGTLTNGVVNQAGQVGKAYEFTSGNSKLTITSGTLFNLSKDYAVSFWFKEQTTSSAYQGYFYTGLPLNAGNRNILNHNPSGSTTVAFTICNADVIDLNFDVGNNVWKYLTIVYNNNNVTVYMNGTYYKNYTLPNRNNCNNNGNINQMFQLGCAGDNNCHQDVLIDEFILINRSISQSESFSLFNRTTESCNFDGVIPTTIIQFASQVPSDITDLTLFSQNVNLTYNYSITNLTNIKLNYSVYGNFSCLQVLNGTCIKLNNTFTTKAQSSNVTSGNFSLISYSLDENEIYNYVINLNGSIFATTLHTQHNLTNPNSWFVDTQYYNSSSAYRIYEAMINTTTLGSGSTYACNSSYNNATPIGNSNCQLIRTFSNMVDFNHSHSVYDSHNLFPYNIINNKINGLSVGFTNTMHFVTIRSTGVVMLYYVPNVARVDTARICNVGTCNNLVGTLNSHDHFWNGNDYLTYQAQGTFNSTFFNTSFTTELIDVSPLSPTSPTITNPLNTTQNTRYMNITYTNATSNTVGGSISRYNISLLNSDLTFNRTIQANNSLNNSYYWDVYAQNLSIKEYYIRVTAIDNIGQESYDQQWFNLTRNALLNVTILNFTGGSGGSFNYSLTDLFNGLVSNGSSSSNSVALNVLNPGNYSITVFSPIIATTTYNFTINSSFYYINITAFPFNSIKISSFSELDGSILNINASLLFFGTSNSFTYLLNGTNNTYYPLPSDTYTVTVTSLGYSTRSYVVTVANTSSQFLNIFMLPSNLTSIIGIYTKDLNDNILASSVVQVQQLVNTSFIGIAQSITDGNGFTTFLLQEGRTYRLIISADNFNIFQINFVPYLVNSPYTFKLSPSSSFQFVTLTDFVRYSFSPTSTTLNTTANTFSLTTYSANGSVIYTYINCNNNVVNTSGVPVGTTVNVNLNVLEGQTVNCTYAMNIVDYGLYSFDVKYRRLSNSTATLRASAEVISNSTEKVWLTLLAFIIMVLTAMGVKQSFPDTRITGVIFIVGTIFFIAIDWINFVAGGVSATIGVLLLYMGSR